MCMYVSIIMGMSTPRFGRVVKGCDASKPLILCVWDRVPLSSPLLFSGNMSSMASMSSPPSMCVYLASWPYDIRCVLAEFSDPATDRTMWPEWRHMYEDVGWWGGQHSCSVCGLKTEYWPCDTCDTYLVPTHQDIDGHWHFDPVCSYRCEYWNTLSAADQ